MVLFLTVGYAADSSDVDIQGAGASNSGSSRSHAALPLTPFNRTREREAVNKIEAVITARKRHNEMLLAFMVREDINPEDKLQTYYATLGVDFEKSQMTKRDEIDRVLHFTKHDLSTYKELESKYIKAIKICISLAEKGVALGSYNLEALVDGFYNCVYSEYLKEKEAHREYIRKVKARNTARGGLNLLQRRGEAVELFYLEEILGALSPFVDEATITMNERYATITADGMQVTFSLDKLMLAPLSLEESYNSALKDLARTTTLLDRFRERVHGPLEEVRAIVVKLQTGGMSNEDILKGIKTFVKRVLSVEEVIEEIRAQQKELQKTKKKKKRKPVSRVAAGVSVAEASHKDEVGDSARQSADEASLESSSGVAILESSDSDEGKANDEIKTEDNVSFASSSRAKKKSERDRKREDRAIMKYVLQSSSLTGPISDNESIRKDALAFKEVAEDNKRNQNVTYHELETVISRMKGHIIPGRGSHRQIEIPHVDTGSLIIGGTYDPHGRQKEKYPFWLELGMDAINRAMA